LEKYSILQNQFLDKAVITGTILAGTMAFLIVLIIQKPD
jgi:hypothetical protein